VEVWALAGLDAAETVELYPTREDAEADLRAGARRR
jgi:hypothetical protein